MNLASQAAVKEKKSDYDKMLSIANPKHGPQFLAEVSLTKISLEFQLFSLNISTFIPMVGFQINAHWSAKEKPEMTPEKLQKISTTVVQPHFRVRWLKWWNSSAMSREALHFPPPGFSDATLESWLPRAAFWAEVLSPRILFIEATLSSLLFPDSFVNSG